MDFKKEIAKTIVIEGFSQKDIYDLLETPRDQSLGDIALPCFKLAKTFKKAPKIIADTIIENIKKSEWIEEINNVNGYINFKLNKIKLIKTVLEKILKEKEKFGSGNKGKNKNVCIEFSSVNIAKPFHIGHLMSTAIGNSIYKIGLKLGYNMIAINYLGDWGTQFGKLIVAYKKWGNKQDVDKGGIKVLNSYYVRFHEEAEKDDTLNEDARKWFKRIEDGDKEAIQHFDYFTEITLKEINKLYDRLNIKYDSFKGESHYNKKTKGIVKELEKKKIIEISDGAKVVKFLDEENNEKLPTCIVERSDGASLYITRDLAAAIDRKKTYNFDKSLYVVAYQQNLYFQQLFAILEKMGCKWSKDLEHIPFGLVSLNTGKMATRHNNVVLLEDVIESAVDKALKTIEQKNQKLKEKKEIAEKIGLGAVLFSALRSARIKDIVFNEEQMLSYEGETSPYIQYTIVRCESVLADFKEKGKKDYSHICDKQDVAYTLVKSLGMFGKTIEDSFEKREPSIIAHYLLDVTKQFNRYYQETRFIVDDDNEKQAKLTLAFATKTVLKEGMRLLGIDCPCKM